MVVRRTLLSRALLLALLCALALTACGEDDLQSLGIVEEWIDEGRSPEVDQGPQAIEVDPNVPRSIDTVVWHNGWEPSVSADPIEVIATVWETSSKEDSFVQASPNEIAAALPGVQFPSMLHPATQEVSSQLVYAGTTGRLDEGVVAAFGLWNTRAYSVSRATGQMGVLFVAFEQEAPVDPEDDSEGCSRFTTASMCEPTTVDGHPAWWVTDLDGETLIWLDMDYRYELLRRPQLDRSDVEMMAASMVPIASLEPPADG